MRRLAICIVGLLFVFCFPGLVHEVAATTADVSAMPAAGLVRMPALEIPSQQHLFGDRGNKRTALMEKAVSFDFFYIPYFQANPSGGLKQTKAGWERVRGTIDVKFDLLISWQGLSFHATRPWETGAKLGI